MALSQNDRALISTVLLNEAVRQQQFLGNSTYLADFLLLTNAQQRTAVKALIQPQIDADNAAVTAFNTTSAAQLAAIQSDLSTKQNIVNSL
jgi:hypothetical protein